METIRQSVGGVLDLASKIEVFQRRNELPATTANEVQASPHNKLPVPKGANLMMIKSAAKVTLNAGLIRNGGKHNRQENKFDYTAHYLFGVEQVESLRNSGFSEEEIATLEMPLQNGACAPFLTLSSSPAALTSVMHRIVRRINPIRTQDITGISMRRILPSRGEVEKQFFDSSLARQPGRPLLLASACRRSALDKSLHNDPRKRRLRLLAKALSHPSRSLANV